MNPKRIYAIFLRQIYLMRRSPTRVIGLLYWSTMELIVWAMITKYLHTAGGTTLNFVSVFLSAAVFWNLFMRVLTGVTISFLEDVWVRNFINLFTTPLRIGEYFLGIILVSITQATIAIVFMTFIAWAFFAYNILQFGMLLIPFMALIFVFAISLGICATAGILRFGPSFEFITWSLPSVIMPFAGVFYPISILPPLAQYISRIIPVSYVFEGMRTVLLEGTLDPRLLWISTIGNIIFFAFAMILLHLAYRNVLKNGLFTKFLTE